LKRLKILLNLLRFLFKQQANIAWRLGLKGSNAALYRLNCNAFVAQMFQDFIGT